MGTVERLSVSYGDPRRFKAYERNARTHSSEQLKQLEASIDAFGFTNPLLVDEEDVLIAGHGRQQAALRKRLPEVPFIVLRGLSDEQKRTLRLADNKLAMNAVWDMKVLAEELASFPDELVGLLGFNDAELAAMDRVQGLTDPEETPPLPTVAVSRPGDTWLMDSHRLACGDACEPEDVKRLLGARQPNLMVTDPPYGVEYDAGWRQRVRLGARALGAVTNDDQVDWHAAFDLFPGNVAYVWHAGLKLAGSQAALEASGFTIRSQIIWAKSYLLIGRGDYHWQHEPCWYAVRKTGHWTGDRKQSTVWHIAKMQKSETGHSTQKPVDCMRRPMLNNSNPGEMVYEPFMGSGTTLIAAAMESRVALGMEIAPEYVDVAVKRWMDFTGRSATLEATGQPFAEVAAERRPVDGEASDAA